MARIEFFDGLFFDGEYFDQFCYDESFFDGRFFDGAFFDIQCTIPVVPEEPAGPPPITYWDVMLVGSHTPTRKKQRKQELETMFLLLG